MLLALPVFTLSQAAQYRRTLIVNGHVGDATVVEIDGHSYVDLEALARLANGSLSFKGEQVVLTLPSSALAQTEAHAASQPASLGFSKDFLRAGIEQMAAVREWRSALENAVQRGFPVTQDWVAAYRDEAARNLRLASVAASTDSDRRAIPLLTNEFNNIKKLTDRFLEANKSRSYVAPDALKSDPLDQKILACAHSLASMAASGQFVDDGSCH
jgi:hypothetical protein